MPGGWEVRALSQKLHCLSTRKTTKKLHALKQPYKNTANGDTSTHRTTLTKDEQLISMHIRKLKKDTPDKYRA
jgi:hypothetical protein